jgi:GNAT superfamily N-acetyltransferase
VAIRPLRREDGESARAIERAAGEQFRDVGLAYVADHEPATLEELAAYADAGRGWVATSSDDQPIGYVVVDIVDGNAHIEQISVHPDLQGKGLGRALVEQVCDWARDTDRPWITLTTFRDVAWNQPLYEHLGFEVVLPDEVGPEFAALVREEAEHWFAPETRVCMRLDVR